jgi:2'-5' RNA ligase
MEKTEKDYYNNFFIGIPFHKKHFKDYKKFLKKLKNKHPYLKITKTRFPHITILFMGKQPKSCTKDIGRVIQEEIQVLEGDEVKIRNFGRFKNTHADILFLDVEKTYQLSEFYFSLTKRLRGYSESEWKTFVPHLTIARIKPEDKERFELDSEEIKKIFSEIKFYFHLEEVALFGRDPAKNNKLVKISSYRIRLEGND